MPKVRGVSKAKNDPAEKWLAGMDRQIETTYVRMKLGVYGEECPIRLSPRIRNPHPNTLEIKRLIEKHWRNLVSMRKDFMNVQQVELKRQIEEEEDD